MYVLLAAVAPFGIELFLVRKGESVVDSADVSRCLCPRRGARAFGGFLLVLNCGVVVLTLKRRDEEAKYHCRHK